MRDYREYKKLPHYPHMSERDKEIWERFISVNPDYYESVCYDYPVGDPPPFNTMTDEDEDWNQDMLYRQRIDVVGERESWIDIIEIKPNASGRTIGQVKGYQKLADRDKHFNKETRCVIITDRLTSDMEFLAKEEKVLVIVV